MIRFLGKVAAVALSFSSIVSFTPAVASTTLQSLNQPVTLYSPSSTGVVAKIHYLDEPSIGEKIVFQVKGDTSKNCEIQQGAIPRECTIGGLSLGSSVELEYFKERSSDSAKSAIQTTSSFTVGSPGVPGVESAVVQLNQIEVVVVQNIPFAYDDPSHAPPTDFEIEQINLTDSSATTLSCAAADTSLGGQTVKACNAVFSGLTPGVEYRYKATAKVSDGSSSAVSGQSGPQDFTAGEPAIPIVSVTAAGGQLEITLTPGNQLSEAPSSYDVTYTLMGQQQATPVSSACTNLDVNDNCVLTITGLSNYEDYEVVASATNQHGTSPISRGVYRSPQPPGKVSVDLTCGNGAQNAAIYLFYDQALEAKLKPSNDCGQGGFEADLDRTASSNFWGGSRPMRDHMTGDSVVYVFQKTDGINAAQNTTRQDSIRFAGPSELTYTAVLGTNSATYSVSYNHTDPVPLSIPDLRLIPLDFTNADQGNFSGNDANGNPRVPTELQPQTTNDGLNWQGGCELVGSTSCTFSNVNLNAPPYDGSRPAGGVFFAAMGQNNIPVALPDRVFEVDVFWTPHLLSTSRLDVQSTANGEVVLEWDAPLESGAGSGLKEYELTYTLSGGSPATQTCAGNTVSTGGNTVVETCTVTGLTVDGEYDFELRTVDTVDRKSATPATVSAFAIAPPGAPTIASATRGDETVTLSVTADATSGVGQPSDYLITATPTSGGAALGPATCAYDNTSTSCTVSGLTNGTEYSFTAEAINNSAPAGSGFVSSAVTATPATTPGLISGLTATPGNTQMVLAWTAPTGDGGDAITDYKVEYQTSSGGTWTLFSDGTSSTPGATVTGLTNGTSYDFRVSALNSVGAGPTASITATPATTPAPVTGLSATSGNTQVALSWTAPSNTGGSPITDYKIEYSTDGSTWTLFNDGVSTSDFTTVTSLTNGTAYTFRVSAVNAVGTALTPVSIAATPATRPGVISGLTATAGNNRVTLSWSAPATGGSAITDYRVEYQTSSGGTWTLFGDGTSSSTSAAVTGLTNGTAYDFRVFAINGVGTQTTPSNIASATPAVPVGPPGTPSLTNVVSGDGKLTVGVGEGTGSTPTSYDITATPVGGGTAIGPVNCQHAGDPTSCEVTGLANGVSYTLTAIAKNSSGNSSVTPVPTSPVAPVAVPGVPSVVAINGDGQATLNITAGTPGGAPTLYEISSTPAVTGGIPDCNVTVNVNPTVCVVTGLTNGTAYTFKARAKNGSGQSASPSAASNSISPIALPAAPSISGVVAGNAKATVTVTAPVSGGAPDDYEVSVVGDSSKKCTISVSASPLSCEITGLTNGVNYQFEATASNSAGASLQASAAVGPAPAAPLAPSVLAVTGNGQATLTLTSGSIGEVTSYGVDVISGGQTVATVSCPATAGTAPTTCVVPNLTNATAYTFEAVANNGAGTSPASSPSNQITPVAPAPPAANNTPTAPSVPSLPTAPGAAQAPAPAVNTSLMPVGNQAAAATVGGQTQPVTVSPASPAVCAQPTSCPVPAGAISNGTSVTVGKTQLSVSGPSMGGSVSNAATTVMPGQPVRIAAGGLAPNSQAAVFALPLGTAIANLFVGSDGKLSAAPRLGQLPANTTAIQITGTTADGPIALSIRVVVANAPEPARTTNQVLPETKPGSNLVLVDGGTSQYSPERLERSLVVEAEGTSLALGVIEDSELAPIRESGDLSVEKTQWLNLTGSGYSEYVDVFLFSEPVFLGRVLVGADGSFVGSLQMPTSVTAGWHTLQTVGKNGEGVEVAASFAIEVLQAEPARFWTRATDDGVKLYGLNVIGAGKIQFFQNGREVAWVTAADGEDPKIRLLTEGPRAGRDYFVRTRQPIAGRNTFEVFVDGERVLRRIFTLRD